MITLKDIARESGFSVNTVSCALRNSDRISKASKQKIITIAERMGYMPNAAARTLRLNKTKVIGVIVTDISNPGFGKMVKGIEKAIIPKEYSILIGNTDEKYDMEKKAIHNMISKRVDGVIITPTQHDTETLEMLKKADIPCILMGRRFREYSANYVISDDIRGGYIVGKYFSRKGVGSLLFINGPKHISSSREREQGLRESLEDHDLVLKKVFYIMPDMREGYRLMQEILNSAIPFSGVFCFDDYTAFGVVKAIKEAGLQVPNDIAVIGYDNTAFGEMLDTGLTSVDSNEYRIGELAAEHIIEIIESRSNTNNSVHVVRQIILDPTIIERGSA